MTQVLSSRLHDYTVYYLNSDEFHHLKGEIFTKDLYYTEFETSRPLIIDAGAHIGMTTLYFKRLYPQARIVAIEPNPEVFPILQRNIAENQLTDVATYQVALTGQHHSEHQTVVPFYLDSSDWHWYSTAGFVKGSWTGDQKSRTIQVPAARLGQFITQPVDLLKMDIEGAEQAVLEASLEQLAQVKQLMIEFHPHPQQYLPRLLDKLESSFDLTLYQKGHEVSAAKARGLLQIEGVNKQSSAIGA